MKHRREKYLRDAQGKRSSVECYAQMDEVMNAWMRDFRDMDDDNDEIIQAICDLSHAYYYAADEQRPKKFKEAYDQWRKDNAHLLKKNGSAKDNATPLTGSSPQSSTLPYPPAPETP